MTSPPSTLRQEITAAAQALGFGEVGFIRVAELMAHPQWAEAAQHLEDWLHANYDASMAWMRNHTEKRTNPSALLPGVQTIVVVTLNHYQGADANPPDQPLKIAQYAWGKDYHRLIRKRLQKLLEQIQQWVPECQGRPVTDSAPLLEKPLATLAGLGWQGKNTLFISPKQGSFLFLGELLLSIDLPDSLADTPALTPPPDLCGRCTRCLDACPTEAFPQPGVLDSHRCISYWTIERPADVAIPPEIATNLNGWVFGCDICQQVCPWNQRFAQPTTDEAFSPRPWLSLPNAKQLLALNDNTFGDQMASNPIKRTGRRVLQDSVNATIVNSPKPAN